ncbi:AraC family transcriptional regulator [Nostoc sp. MG11]|uniref:AraC family transcriptional regulator n=1 Tax=Nostoc sp. MG11 TaxID=2721166 RepID=UPI0018674681|nr:AraC family transcriptional regulator [Nostoc sp. MG11]
MDVIDQLLADLRQESCVFCQLEATEPWRIQKSASSVAPFYVVLSGKAQIGTANNLYDLYEGDFLVLPSGEPHDLTGFDSARAPAVPLLRLLDQAGIEPYRRGMRYRRTVHLQHGGGGSQSVILVGIFSFGDPYRNPLLTALPPVLVVRCGTDCNIPWLRTIPNAIAEELAEGQPGSNLVVTKLTDLLFMQALRTYLATDLHNSVGWMRGIMDPLVGRAIGCMHAAPERRWTLQMLAEEVGCSRAVFAQRFSTLVGQGALSYLTAWRMHVAAGLLLDGTNNIGTVSGRVGYRSDAAFSIAFKRWSGIPPSQYRAEMLRASTGEHFDNT